MNLTGVTTYPQMVVFGLLILVAVLIVGAGGGIAAYGLAIGLAPFVGIGLAVVGQHGILEPGDHVPVRNLSKALGSLLVASAATAFMLNVNPLAVEYLATDQQAHEPGRFLNALLIARIPLFFFQAVQASLLPKLSGLAGSHRHDELWHVLRRLLALVLCLGALAVLGCWMLAAVSVTALLMAVFVERRLRGHGVTVRGHAVV